MWQLWTETATQWRMGPGGPVGLDYPAVAMVARAIGVEYPASARVRRLLRCCESRALTAAYRDRKE